MANALHIGLVPMKTITTSMIYAVTFLHTLFAVFSYVMQFLCSAKAVPTSNYHLITPSVVLDRKTY